MAAWELVLHHDYRGQAGVIFDRSPGRGAHGRGSGVAVDDFRSDGKTTGSGAVRLRGGNASIRIDLERPWTVLRGLSIAIICTSDVLTRTGTLLDGDSFRIDCTPGSFSFTLKTTEGTDRVVINHEVTAGGWSSIYASYTQGMHTGFDGPLAGEGWTEGVSVDNIWRGTVLPVRRIAIGNSLRGGNGITGVIDDVQISRLNPLAIDEKFRDRPVDGSVRHCWNDWMRRVLALLNEDRECALHLAEMMNDAQNSLLRAARSNDLYGQSEDTARAYGDAWTAGRLDEIPAGAIAFANLLKAHGLDPTADAALTALLQDDCFRRILERVPLLECDPAFTEMLTAIGEGLRP